MEGDIIMQHMIRFISPTDATKPVPKQGLMSDRIYAALYKSIPIFH